MRNNILENLVRIKPNKDLYFKKEAFWVFPDGLKFKSGLYSPIVILYHQQTPIGIINYTNKPTSKNISINFIQGIKQEGTGFNYGNLSKPFYEIILDSFIASSIHTGKAISYEPVNFQRRFNKEIISIKKDQFIKNLQTIKELEVKIKTEKNKDLLKNLISKSIEYKKVNLDLGKTIENINNLIVINGKIRDRYFTKKGKLNPNKERVKKIILQLKVKNKKPSTFRKITKIFKIRKIK